MLKKILGVFAFLMPTLTMAQGRVERNLKYWQFSHDSIHWQSVTVPHDWAIKGPFDKKWDLQMVAIEQNGESEKTEKSGRSGALPWIGKGYYTTNIHLDSIAGQYVELYFDGAMAEPVVYVNGKRAGSWAYGYAPFKVDITQYIKKGDNRVDVSLNNVEESSRWYPGAGLYRPVTLIVTNKTHLDPWKTFVKTQRITKVGTTKAVMSFDVALAGASKDFKGSLELSLIDNTTGEKKDMHDLRIDGKSFKGGFRVDNPKL